MKQSLKGFADEKKTINRSQTFRASPGVGCGFLVYVLHMAKDYYIFIRTKIYEYKTKKVIIILHQNMLEGGIRIGGNSK